MEIRVYDDGVGIWVYVTANARKELLFIRSDNNLGIKVAAPALENKANSRIIELTAKYLGIAKTSITIRRGEHAKRKELFIKNYGSEEILRLLSAALSKQ